jgi:hypothetical protein
MILLEVVARMAYCCCIGVMVTSASMDSGLNQRAAVQWGIVATWVLWTFVSGEKKVTDPAKEGE